MKNNELLFLGYADGRQHVKAQLPKTPDYMHGYALGTAVRSPVIAKNSMFFTQALETITNVRLPFGVPWENAKGMCDDDFLMLQDWCASHAPHDWMTGIGIIEAAEALVRAKSDTYNELDTE